MDTRSAAVMAHAVICEIPWRRWPIEAKQSREKMLAKFEEWSAKRFSEIAEEEWRLLLDYAIAFGKKHATAPQLRGLEEAVVSIYKVRGETLRPVLDYDGRMSLYRARCALCGVICPKGKGRLAYQRFKENGKKQEFHILCADHAAELAAAKKQKIDAAFENGAALTMRNKFANKCVKCFKWVSVGSGFCIKKEDGKWGVLCVPCQEMGTRNPLTLPATLDLPTFTAEHLMPYQKEDTTWMVARKRAGKGALLANDPGTGKTASVLATLTTADAVLVIGPKSVQRNWEREIRGDGMFPGWMPHLRPIVLPGKADYTRWPRPGEIMIARWSNLPTIEQMEGMGDIPAGMVLILDEVHYGKNDKAQRTRLADWICTHVMAKQGVVFGLSGTPILNRPTELWNILDLMGLSLEAFTVRNELGFTDKSACWQRFCWLFDGDGDKSWGVPRPEAKEALRAVMIRRRVDDVLQLPPKTYERIDVPLSSEAAAACDELVRWAGSAEELKRIVEEVIEGRGEESKIHFMKMRRIVAEAKIPHLLNIIDQHKEETPCVFSCIRAPVEVLEKERGFGAIYGDKSAEERYELVRSFQDGELPGFAYTLAGAEGINLTRGNVLYRVSLDWSPGRNRQADDRLRRIGQVKPVRIIDLIGDHIVEEIIHEILMKKQMILKGVGLE